MAQKSRKDRQEDMLSRAPDYRKHYATNVMSRLTDADIRIDFLNEKLPEQRHFVFVADVGTILTFEAAAILRDQLDSLLDKREKQYGKIAIGRKRARVKRAKEVLISGP